MSPGGISFGAPPPRARARSTSDDEYLAYLAAIHDHLSALLQSFRPLPPADVETRMRDAMMALRRRRQVLRLHPRGPVRLFELERRFQLDDFESFALSMLAAYLFSGEIRQEIAAISETRMDYVSLELLARLYYPTRVERMAAVRTLIGGTLFREHLVDLSAARTSSELLFAPLELQPHIANYLLGVPVLREVLPLEHEVTQPAAEPFTERALGDHLVAACGELAVPRMLLSGPRGAGKSTLARQLAGRLGRELITLEEPVRATSWRGLISKVRAHDAFVLLRNCAALLQAPTHEFLEALDAMDVPVLLACENGIDVSGRVRRRMQVVVEIAETTAAERAQVWRGHLAEAYATAPERGLDPSLEPAIDDVCASFRLTRTQIGRVVAALRQRSAVPPSADELVQACQRQLHP